MEFVFKFLGEISYSLGDILLAGAIFLLWAAGSLTFAGYTKQRQKFPTGYSRKIFHFLIFGAASAVQWHWGFPGVCLFGVLTSLVIFYGLLRGDGHPWYEALAREKDAPYRTRYIIIPYLATLVGGLGSNIFFGKFALIGFLVTGIGDAIAEPVGVRFGKHAYRVPVFGNLESIRTVEGSLAVFLGSLGSLLLGMMMLGVWYGAPLQISLTVGLSLVCAVLEAATPHGWDNTTLQIIPTLLVWELWG